MLEFFPRASPPGLARPTPPVASPVDDFAKKLMKQLKTLGKGRNKSKPRDDGDSDEEYSPHAKEAETVEVPAWPKMDTFSLWLTQLTRNVNAAAARPDDKAIAC